MIWIIFFWFLEIFGYSKLNQNLSLKFIANFHIEPMITLSCSNDNFRISLNIYVNPTKITHFIGIYGQITSNFSYFLNNMLV